MAAIQDHADWMGVRWVSGSDDSHKSDTESERQVKLLDYACGTGLVTRVSSVSSSSCSPRPSLFVLPLPHLSNMMQMKAKSEERRIQSDTLI